MITFLFHILKFSILNYYRTITGIKLRCSLRSVACGINAAHDQALLTIGVGDSEYRHANKGTLSPSAEQNVHHAQRLT